VVSISAAALFLTVGLWAPSGVRADEADAKHLLKAMVGVLRDKYNRPFPAAELLMSKVYGELMADVDS